MRTVIRFTAYAVLIACVLYLLHRFAPYWMRHPLGQCTSASSIKAVAIHEIERCKSYNFWSGSGSDVSEVTIVAGFLTWWHHVNCIEPRCWRKGHKDPEHGHPLCTKHQSKLADHPVNA